MSAGPVTAEKQVSFFFRIRVARKLRKLWSSDKTNICGATRDAILGRNFGFGKKVETFEASCADVVEYIGCFQPRLEHYTDNA